MSPPNTETPPGRTPGPRIGLLIAAGLAGLLSLAFLAAGGALLWANSEKDDDGYLTTSSERFTTGTHALATDDLDLDLDGLGAVVEDGRLGGVRLKADARGDEPVFVGIARSRDVAAYLRGTAHTRVTDVHTDPFRAQYRDSTGTGTPARPAQQRFWAAAAHGRGSQALTWDVEDGDWSIVVMNEDGTAGVDASVSAGARLSFLAPAGWTALGGGALLLATAAGLVYLGLRPPRTGAPATPPLAPTPQEA